MLALIREHHGASMTTLAERLRLDPLQIEPVLDQLVAIDWVGRLDEAGSARYVLLRDPAQALAAPLVDHFLLVQGLESVGLTEADIDFRGVLTDVAAASFAAGEFDCVGVFAPFWLTALEREGSNELFSSADFPGLIPDHIVVSRELVDENPAAVQKLVDAWYLTLDYIDANPDESIAIMAEVAETTIEEYESFADGTTLFTAEEALAAFEAGDDTSSLLYTAELINPFLVESEFTEEEAPLDGLFDSSFTADWLARQGE